MSDITQSTGSMPEGKHSVRNASIKQNLFRFVHVRDVKISTEDDDEASTSIIRIPDKEASAFLFPIEDLTEAADIKSALNTTIEGFSYHKTFREANSINPEVAKISNWVSKNKGKLKLEPLLSKFEGLEVTPYSNEQKVELWDNLIYQTLTQKSLSVRDNLLKLIKGNFFIEKFIEETQAREDALETDEEGNPIYLDSPTSFTKEEKAMVEKFAGARVMIPSNLFPKENISNTPFTKDTKGDRNLIKILNNEIAKEQIKELQNLEAAFKKLEKIYNRQNSNAYNGALKLHEVAVKDAYANATKITDPDTGEVSYEGLVLPEFNFTPLNPFDEDFMVANLSESAFLIYKNRYEGNNKDLADVLSKIAANIDFLYQKISKNIVEPDKTVYVNGSKITSRNMPSNNKTAMKSISRLEDNEKSVIYLSIYNPDKNAFVKNSSILIGEDGDAIQGKFVNELDNLAIFKFDVSDGIVIDTENTLITGVYTAEDEKQYNFGTNSFRKEETWTGTVTKKGEYSYCYIDRKTGCTICKTTNGWEEIDCPRDLDGEPGTNLFPLFGIKKIGIAEFKRVEQELCCYVEGEVSHIENILAREYKEKSTRSLTRTEITTEESNETEVENLSDTTSTDRHEMQQEVGQVLEESKDRNFGASTSVSGTYAGINMSANASFDGTNSSSTSNTFNQSESFAKEVTERAMERIVKKSSHKRTSRMLREFEDNQKHGFDNRKGSKHVTGIYRWVDKIYKNSLVNYGRRLIYEFSIPEPAKNWKELITVLKDDDTLYSPKKPLAFNYVLPSQITRTNYARLAALYGADVSECPESEISVGKSFVEDVYKTGSEANPDVIDGAYNFEVEIPEGYYCKYVKRNIERRLAGLVNGAGGSGDGEITLRIGSNDETITDYDSWGLDKKISIERVEKTVPIYVLTREVGTLGLNITAICELKEEVLLQWQNQTFIAILKAYQSRLQEYNDAMAQIEAVSENEEPFKDYNNNPLKNRIIEQQELKKLAIQYMLSHINGSIRMGTGHYGEKNATCKTYPVIQSQGLENYAEHISFLEQAIDWNIMSYTFHPYYWAACDQWSELMKTTSNSDLLFEAFLQAGFANMRVPVRGGYEKAMMFFLDTGRIWKDGDVLVDDLDNVYISVDRDLALPSKSSGLCCNCDEAETEENKCKCGDEEDLCVEAIWNSRVPTSLTIVQDYAAPLNAKGLPCFSKEDPKVKFCEDGTPIAYGESIMEGNTNSNLLDNINALIEAGAPVIEVIGDLIEQIKNNNNSEEDNPGYNNSSEYDCSQLYSNFDNEVSSYNAALSNYEEQSISCDETLNSLNKVRDTIMTYIDEGNANGFDVSTFNNTLSQVEESIATIEAECNPPE